MSLAAIPVARVRSIPFPSQLVSSDFFFFFPHFHFQRGGQGVQQACGRRALRLESRYGYKRGSRGNGSQPHNRRMQG